MSSPFKAGAQFYDMLYRDKDYQSEANYIATLVKRYTNRTPSEIRLLDLACGTGRHALILDTLGFKVDGSDGSKEMIELAKEVAKQSKRQINFYDLPFEKANELPGPYDAVISMFAAINYLTAPDGLSLMFRKIKQILKPGGIFAFDFWQGSAVVKDYEPVRVLRKKNENQEILRIAETALDKSVNGATVKYTCMFFENEIRKIEFEEVHLLRYFFLPEMFEAIETAGFKMLYRGPFLQLDMPLQDSDWYASLVIQRED